jgi:hypothetical protein
VLPTAADATSYRLEVRYVSGFPVDCLPGSMSLERTIADHSFKSEAPEFYKECLNVSARVSAAG